MNETNLPILTDFTSEPENFAQLFEESLQENTLAPGSLIKAEVIAITSDHVVVSAGLKSEAHLPRSDFLNLQGELEVKVGDVVEVILKTVANGLGETLLSREQAKREEILRELEDAAATERSVIGNIIERVRGGFIVEVNKVRAFLPGSLVDVKPVQDYAAYEGKTMDFKVVKVDRKTNNIVVSRKAAIIAETSLERRALLEKMHEGDVVKGVVKNLTDYGAFIDLGGVDGLLHITDISWKRIRHPNEVLKLGQELDVKILKYDRDKNRVSLGLKQLSTDPWQDLNSRYPKGAHATGKVTNITDYGCFVEIERGIEGLVHVSEMDWTNKNIAPAKFVTPGQEVEVMILEIDESKRRISLGMKQCKANPWLAFAEKHQKGEKIHGVIKSITDFGLFIGLDGSIDGLVHLSDLSWSEPGEKVIRNYQKGQEVDVVVLAVDAERERISLGIKQLEHDVYTDYIEAHPKGSIVAGKVISVTTKEALIDLGEGIVGKIKAADISREKVQDATHYLAMGDEIEAKIMNLDRRSRQVNLSIKAMQADMTKEADSLANTQLGDQLKEQMQQDEEPKQEEAQE